MPLIIFLKLLNVKCYQLMDFRCIENVTLHIHDGYVQKF